ncbi:MAG: hypothetical protein ABJQ34_03980 [Paracoccaceae bacterium]
MTVLFAKEGETTWLSDVALSDIPGGLPAGIQVLVKSGNIGLRIDGLVGALPLGRGQTLRILPKIGNANFFAMFFRAEGALEEAERDLERLVEYATSSQQTVEGVVARSLIFSADEIQRRGPMIGRISRVVEARSAVGAIDVASTVRKLKAGAEKPVVSKSRSRSLDIAENRIITCALGRALRVLSIEDQERFGNIAHAWARTFPASNDLRADLESVERVLARNGYGGPRGYYQKAITASLIVLGVSGISLSGSNTIHGEAVLINTPDIFEKFLRNTIRKQYSNRGLMVTKTGLDSTSLYTNGSYSLEPDIMVYKNGEPALLCDAKYKTPTSADHYQMQTYLKRLGLNSGILLCPNFDGATVELREFRSPDSTVVREIYLPMQKLDLTEAYLGTLIQKFSI